MRCDAVRRHRKTGRERRARMCRTKFSERGTEREKGREKGREEKLINSTNQETQVEQRRGKSDADRSQFFIKNTKENGTRYKKKS